MQPHDLLTGLLDLFRAGGGLMLPLLLLSLAVWTLALAKGAGMVRERRREATPQRCLELCGQGREPAEDPAPWQRDITSAFLARRCGDQDLDHKLLTAMRVRSDAEDMRHVRTILILAAVAPMLGLLGTVAGMISTFDVIAQFGTGNARALASGISQALITTQSGLVAAVPGLLLGGLLLGLARRRRERMELFCMDLHRLARNGGAGERP